jgi:hypothetical protein
MNKIVHDFIVSAVALSVERVPHERPLDRSNPIDDWIFTERFYASYNILAELIVKECANIVNSIEQYEGQGDCSTAEYIKEYFGVEDAKP